MDNNKVCMLASTHYPKDARIYRREATALRDAGYDVTIALLLNDPLPEPEHNISWISVPRPKNRFMRIFSGFSLMRAAMKTNAKIYHIHDVELFHLAFLLRLMGRKAILDVHEAFPDRIAEKGWVLPWLRWAVHLCVFLWQWFFSVFANRVITSSRAQSEYFNTRKTDIVYNFPPGVDEGIDQDSREKLIIYVGVMYPSRMVDEMLDIGNHLKDSGYRVEIYGPMHQLNVNSLLEKADEIPAAKLHEGFLPKAEVDEKVGRAMFGLCFLRNNKAMNKIVTIKVFEYMAQGVIPVVTETDTLSEFMIDGENSIVVKGMDTKSTAERILELAADQPRLDRIRRRCIEDIRTKYNWDIQKQRLLGVYQKLFV